MSDKPNLGKMIERATYGLTMAVLVFLAGNQSSRASDAEVREQLKAAQVEQKTTQIAELERAEVKTLEGYREYILATYEALEHCSCEID